MTEAEPILYVIDYFRDPNAGTEGQLKQLIDNLDRTRFSPRLLVFRGSDYLDREGFSCPVTVLGQGSLMRPGMWAALYRFARRQAREGVRLAHVYFNDASVICPPVFALAGMKTLISRRDMGYWYTPKYRLLLRITQRFVKAAVVNSRAVGEVTSATEGIEPARIRVIYNGYRSEPQREAAIADLQALRENGLPLAGLVANIRPIKRIQDAIEALALLRAQDIDLQLVVIGSGDPAELNDLAQRRGVADRVFFLGPRDDVQRCLDYFDVALLCSESEGFSNAIVEYQYAGLPVICSDTGGNPEAIIDGETGFLFPVADVKALADHLQTLVEDPGRRQQMGGAAAASARQRFAVETMVAEHEQLYRQVLA